MSGFVVVFERSNQACDPQVIERVMERLSHRGPDGRDVLQFDSVVMGHWHFWTTPEEVGERQPLSLPGLPYTLVFDGRLDNRPELLPGLGIAPTDGASMSDAALVLRCYDRWGQDCFTRFVGEFALVIYDQNKGELLCVRDQLGDRTLFYTLQGSQVSIASEPWAVAGAIPGGAKLNDNVLAASFAFRVPQDGQTFFQGVTELLPAHTLTIKSESAPVARRYWQADLTKKLRGLTDQEYADQFRALLEQAVLCRMRSTTPVGVMMSGLDLTSVACFAAQNIAPNPLTTISYVFDELTECDERQYINAMVEKWGLNSIQIPCDDAWTFKEWQNWPRNPNRPEQDFHRVVHERVYEKAHTEGLRVLLDGDFGDHLYGAWMYWLVDLIKEGNPHKTLQELGFYLHTFGLRKTWKYGYIQLIAKELLNMIPGGRYVHRPDSPPYWLTNYAKGLLNNIGVQNDRSLERTSSLLGIHVAEGAAGQDYYTNRHNLELRHPFRDRRLIEYVLSLSAFQLYRHGLFKHILRNAMQGILPESIITRQIPTSYGALFYRGIERERLMIEADLKKQTTLWHKFVKLQELFEIFTSDSKWPDVLVPWVCVTSETWHALYLSNYQLGEIYD